MSETTGPQIFTNPEAWDDFTTKKFLGETGIGMGGVETRIINADSDENGEVCMRGNLFLKCRKKQVYGILQKLSRNKICR